MSKKSSEKQNIENSDTTPQKNNSHSPDMFSFLELNQFLTQENIQAFNNNSNNINKSTKKKLSSEKNKPEKKQKLKIKPNVGVAREQTSDDLMYIEKEDNNDKEESEKELKKENITKEKSLPKKKEEKKKIDRRIVKLNLEKEKSEEKSKNKKKEFDSDKKESTNKVNKEKAHDIETIINNIKDKDPQAYTPIILPFEKDNFEEKSLKEELIENNEDNENKLFIFQFPRQIPIKDLNNQIKTKEEENPNVELIYDNNTKFLIAPEFKNPFQEIKDNTMIGKLIIMKSGKIKIKMGDVYFDINQGSLTKFSQISAVITGNDDNQAYILGQLFNKKLIVTPEFD